MFKNANKGRRSTKEQNCNHIAIVNYEQWEETQTDSIPIKKGFSNKV